jgi:DegV family protein with EDD domain
MMMRIVTDGAIDMPFEWYEKYRIDIIPLMVRFGEEVYTQGVNLDAKSFYALVRQKNIIPKSSLPSPAQIVEFYRKIASGQQKILSIHVASKMSGTFNSVQMAADELKDELEITPFDSGAGSAAMGFMCREARLMDQAGRSLKEILCRLEEIRNTLSVIFTLDTLEFARMNGRVGTLTSLMSTIIKIKPIIVLKDGLLQISDKVRTRQKSLERILETVKERVGSELVDVAVVHADDPETAKLLFEKAKQFYNIRDLIITELSIPVAANLGPQTVGIVAVPVKEETA